MRGEDPFPEGSGGNDVEDLSQSQASVESQIREIERKEKEQQEQKAALLAKRRKPSTPGTVQKVKKPRTTAPDKIYCEAGEHYVNPDEHWSSNEKYSSWGDCMNCSSLKDIAEVSANN